jgi:hypothetical protein
MMSVVGLLLPGVKMAVGRRLWWCRMVFARVFLCSQQLARGATKCRGWAWLELNSCPLIRFWMGKLLGMAPPLLSI